MPIRTIDHPRRIDRDCYLREIECVVSRLSTTEFVQSIYQIGSIRHPGISDIDLVVVVDGNVSSDFDPRARLSAAGRYLFTHSLFAVPENLIGDFCKFTMFHNFQLLWGFDSGLGVNTADNFELQLLKRQIALEFLAKNYIDLSIQAKYRILKLRVLLQHLKGLTLDLDFLNITDGEVLHLLNDSAKRINCWFERNDGANYFGSVFMQLAAQLETLLADILIDQPMASPWNRPFRFASNVIVEPCQSLSCSHRGIVLPQHFACLGRKYFNVQHRLNQFVFSLPMQTDRHGSYLERRFAFFSRIQQHVAQSFPHFSAPVTPLFYKA